MTSRYLISGPLPKKNFEPDACIVDHREADIDGWSMLGVKLNETAISFEVGFRFSFDVELDGTRTLCYRYGSLSCKRLYIFGSATANYLRLTFGNGLICCLGVSVVIFGLLVLYHNGVGRHDHNVEILYLGIEKLWLETVPEKIQSTFMGGLVGVQQKRNVVREYRHVHWRISLGQLSGVLM
jgi:hypothetical protein